ncbi:unnamed protein product [Phytophthora fragariaefolia]|uniref:Unnamed protein product n=1 Tax=Phytophthora fragariaefolia TaxID=1490495 RepID=A0A9W6WYB4_9STRA|nr:unnamed protein product [Phytophthora fragariaefolia]
MHEKTVLKEEFPQARQLLCQWHVVTWLKKHAARMASVKKEVKTLMGLLVYARSKMEYDEAGSTMKGLLGGDESDPLYRTFFGELGQLAGGMGVVSPRQRATPDQQHKQLDLIQVGQDKGRGQEHVQH